MSAKIEELDDTRLNEVLKGISIPSSPAVLTELATELRKPLVNNKQIAHIIGKDVGLAAIVIKSANSPLFGSTRRISSIADGINLIGFGTLTNLVYEGLLRSHITTHEASLERFWDNSAHAAGVSSELADIMGDTSPDTAYTFGLFHDCGIPMLVQRFPNYKDILRQANESRDRSFTTVEEETISTNHATIGCLLARSWGLPETVSTGILCHHEYDVLLDPQGLADESLTLIAISALADYITGQHLRLRQDMEWLKAAQKVATYFGRSPQEIEDIADDVLYRLDKKAHAKEQYDQEDDQETP